MPAPRKLMPLNMRVSKDWTFSWEALKYKVLGTHRICHVCRLCHPSAVLPDPSWLPPHQASFFCQKKISGTLPRSWSFMSCSLLWSFFPSQRQTYRSGSAATFCWYRYQPWVLRLLQRGWQIPSLKKANGQNGQYSTAVFDLTPTLASPFAQHFSAIEVSPTFHF